MQPRSEIVRRTCRGGETQEERSVVNGTEDWELSGPFTCGENEDSSWARGELRSSGCRDRSPNRHLDLRRFKDPNEKFVHLVTSVPPAGPRSGTI
jgi:hypothetical protein